MAVDTSAAIFRRIRVKESVWPWNGRISSFMHKRFSRPIHRLTIIIFINWDVIRLNLQFLAVFYSFSIIFSIGFSIRPRKSVKIFSDLPLTFSVLYHDDFVIVWSGKRCMISNRRKLPQSAFVRFFIPIQKSTFVTDDWTSAERSDNIMNSDFYICDCDSIQLWLTDVKTWKWIRFNKVQPRKRCI